MPAWLVAVLRVIGIRRAADVVPVATRAVEAIAEAIDGEEPGKPMSRATENHIRAQIDSATSHKVPAPSRITFPSGPYGADRARELAEPAPVLPCDKPPPGWFCSRERGHVGPCAAWPSPPPGGTLVIKAAPPGTPPRPPRRKGK